MKLRYAFKRTIANKSAGADKELKPEVPDGMLKKCNACKAAVFVDEVKKNAYICPHCGNYFRRPGRALQSRSRPVWEQPQRGPRPCM